MMYEAPDARLYYAVIDNNLEKLQAIINEGRNLDEFYFDDQNISTKSLLHVACEKGRYDCVKMLIENNAALDVRDKWGQSPLMYSIAAGHAEVAELLLKKNGELCNDSDSYGKSAIHSAAERGYLEGINVLLNYGANINQQSIEGLTALTKAICQRDLENCEETVMCLIERGADVNIKDRRNKRSPLQNACITRKIKIVELLLQVGADTNSLDGAGRTALTNIICLHVKNVHGVSLVPDDVMTIIVMLVQAGIDLDLNICEYCNAMMTAAYIKAEPLIRFFLEQGADANLSSVMGVTSLLISVSKGDILSVKTFLEWNAKMDTPGLIYKKREDKEYTVDSFELAVMEGHFDIAKIMVWSGYNKFRKPYIYGKGSFPVSLEQNPDMKKWLLEKSGRIESLLNLTIYTLRRILGRNVKMLVKRLPLPARVRGKIALAEVLNIQDDFSV